MDDPWAKQQNMDDFWAKQQNMDDAWANGPSNKIWMILWPRKKIFHLWRLLHNK
jgi:hypothetical protein